MIEQPSLPTGASPTNPGNSVGNQDGERLLGEEIAVLASLEIDPPRRVMLPCYQCGRESEFLAQFDFPQGWWGVCLGCGEERLVRYTRTVSE